MRELSMLEVESVVGGDGWTCTVTPTEVNCAPDASSQQGLQQAAAEAMALFYAMQAQQAAEQAARQAAEQAQRQSSGNR
ncbi:MAG: hypothetical protein IPK77_14585 [Cellvibrio sp.]|nr:hypothetical protein [Cellvibrio sp.]